MDEKIISKNIKKLRIREKITLEALAKRTGLTKGSQSPCSDYFSTGHSFLRINAPNV